MNELLNIIRWVEAESEQWAELKGKLLWTEVNWCCKVWFESPIIHFFGSLKWHFHVEVVAAENKKREQFQIVITYRIIYCIVNNIDGLALSKTNNLIGF